MNDWWAIFVSEKADVMRDEGSGAVLAFPTRLEACQYAAKNWGYSSYKDAARDGWCDVRRLQDVRELVKRVNAV